MTCSRGQEPGTPSAQTLTLGSAPPAREKGKGTRAPSALQRLSRPAPLLAEHSEMPQRAEHTAKSRHPVSQLCAQAVRKGSRTGDRVEGSACLLPSARRGGGNGGEGQDPVPLAWFPPHMSFLFLLL